MHNYELMCVLQPDLDENSFKSAIDKVQSWISESGGSVGKVDVWGRRRLAYPIHKQTEGQYVLLNISIKPSSTADLERNLRYQETILRHMLTLVA